jgi:hypothetical protein
MEGSLVAYKVFTNGSVLNASEVNDNLMNQAVITFTNSTARGSAIPSPVEGMLTYLEDTNGYQFWDGSAWTALTGSQAVLQVVTNSTGTTTTTTSTSFADVTDMTVTITPQSATSNIFVFASTLVNAYGTTGGNIYGRLSINDASNTQLEGAKQLFFGNQNFSYTGTASYLDNAYLIGFVASGSTAARTYKLRSAVDSATTSFAVNAFGKVGQMIAIEVAA